VTEADRIWNRALDLDYQPELRGDRALKDVLGFHSLAMNGGFSHSLEVDFGQASRAAKGLHLFGHEVAAGLIDRGCALVAPFAESDQDFDLLHLPEASLEELDELDATYGAEIDDAEIERCFTTYLAGHPDEFAAL
jgi:hypothetical protein